MALQDEGKVRMIGVSNTYDVNILHALSRERKVQVVQNRWYEGNGWDKSVLSNCQEHEIQYQCVVRFAIDIRRVTDLTNTT
jgi:diketogulonate reductase-like aldo/keto reductase